MVLNTVRLKQIEIEFSDEHVTANMYKVLLRIETEERISEGMYAKAD